MSKVAIQGNASGTGTLTIAAPNTNTDRTLTLPDSAGTMMLTDTGVTTAQMPAGSVLQVVQAVSSSTNKTTTSTSFVSTGTSATITPLNASSKILVQYNCHADPNSGGTLLGTVYRGATNLGTGNANSLFRIHDVSAGRFLVQQHAIILDSPNTTSAVTYTTYFLTETGIQVRIRDDIILSTFILMEIAA
jgi:hypothetical protein